MAQFNEIALKAASGFVVRLRDVGLVEEAAASERSRVRLNGLPSISTGVIRNATANPLEVAAGVRAVMPQIQRDLPASVTVPARAASRLVTTGTSLVPWMVTVTRWLAVPSAETAVKLSVRLSLAPSCWMAVWLLLAV